MFRVGITLALFAGWVLSPPELCAVPHSGARAFETPKITEPPVPVYRVTPDYPLAMYRAGIAGEVLIEFIVDAEGNVRETYPVRSSHPAFRGEAVLAVSQWRFRPGTVNGEPVANKMRVAIFFSLPASVQRLWKIDRPKTFPDSVPEEMRWDEAPVLREYQPPAYPRIALMGKMKGRVEIGMVIGKSGRVIKTMTIRGRHEPLMGAATAAVESFVFEAARKNGAPSGAMVKMTFDFGKSKASDAPVTSEMARLIRLLKRNPEKIVPLADLDETPKPLFRSAPVVPPAHLKRSEQAEVVVEFIINRQGMVQLPRVISETAPAFGYAVMQAAVGWQFEIPRENGEPVDALVRLPLLFPANYNP